MNAFFISSVFSTFLFFFSSFSYSEFTYLNFMDIPAYALVGYVVEVFNTRDSFSCLAKCFDVNSFVSVNFGRRSANDSQFTCEINNSTHLLQPLGLKRRPGFTYFGVADPCFSNPCLNGGTCTADQSNWTYRCSCGLPFPTAPYLDKHCSTGLKFALDGGVYRNVFHAGAETQYIFNFKEAKRLCQKYQAQLASVAQVEEAWKVGFQMCSWGWAAEGFTVLPLRVAHGGCGTKAEVRRSASVSTESYKSNAYCHRGTDNCNEEGWYQNRYKCYRFFLDSHVRWEEASRVCHVHGGVMGVFNSIDKLDFVRYHVPTLNNSISRIFVGLQKTGGVWMWGYNNLTPEAELWESGAPASQGPLGAVTIATGRLVDVPDSGDHKLPFVCEKNLP
ncbi:uncharacterized protein LOC5509931 isoform X2 [Nematostella vectensis]|uniref:uncharacterized protein LOC5509931 isoform X2 n=1 Tax=Nematostella vectensis TaxID=45351 RepID=UPI0020771082|nr:uncharacterized protein LOC5509931 isoform X2 [Nematostella vectensis]